MTLRRYLDALDAVAPVARDTAAAAARQHRLDDEVIAGLVEGGLFRLWVPASLGGGELALPDALAVFEAAARVDGALGWAVMIGAGGGLFAAWLPEPTAAAIFRPADARIAGSGAPAGTGTPVPGGLRVTGRWRYASGAPSATWFTASVRVGDRVLAVAVPRSEARVEPTWEAAGMAATASHDLVLDDVLVPTAHTFDLAAPPRESGPLYRAPFLSLSEASFAAVATGVALQGLEAFDTSARERAADAFGVRAVDARDTAARRAEAEARVQSARAWLGAEVDALWATVQAGDVPDAAAQDRVRLAAVHAAASAAGALDLVTAVAGMEPLMPGRLGRAWRDAHAVARHVLVSAPRYADVGLRLIGGA